MLSQVIMWMIWLCFTSVLSFPPVFSNQNVSQIRVFPAGSQSIAGVIQVSFVNDLNQVEYAYDASGARHLCRSLGLEISSKAQVEKALSRGLETCRFGWIDEHLAVIPRIHALANCGKNRTGLVPWRASLIQKFDAFCFNESDAATQLKDATTDSPLSTSWYSKPSLLPTEASSSKEVPSEGAPFTEAPSEEASAKEAPSKEGPFEEDPFEEASSKEALSKNGPFEEAPSEKASSKESPFEDAPTEEAHSEEDNSFLTTLTPKTTIYEVEPARFVSSTHSSTGGKVVLITCTCGLVLVLVAVLMYIKLRRSCSLGSDKQQQQQQLENVQTEEWKCENVTETKINVQDEQKIHEEDSTQ